MVANSEKDGFGARIRDKLNESIKHKCIYSLFNDRGSVFTMGFKLESDQDMQALKGIEVIYKEDMNIHQFLIPFETNMWSAPSNTQQQNEQEAQEPPVPNPAPQGEALPQRENRRGEPQESQNQAQGPGSAASE